MRIEHTRALGYDPFLLLSKEKKTFLIPLTWIILLQVAVEDRSHEVVAEARLSDKAARFLLLIETVEEEAGLDGPLLVSVFH